MALKQTIRFKYIVQVFGYFGIINEMDDCTLF